MSSRGSTRYRSARSCASITRTPRSSTILLPTPFANATVFMARTIEVGSDVLSRPARRDGGRDRDQRHGVRPAGAGAGEARGRELARGGAIAPGAARGDLRDARSGGAGGANASARGAIERAEGVRAGLERAGAHCDLALEFCPESGDALTNKGLIAYRRGRSAEAKRLFGAAIHANQEQAQAYNDLGVVYLDEKDWPQARRAFERALKTNPDYSEARYNLGL